MIKRTLSELHDTATVETDGRLMVYVLHVFYHIMQHSVVYLFAYIHRNGVEIAIVYYRTAYHPIYFPTEKEWSVYLLLEQSRAIKCPSVSYHLAGTKKIQQMLYNPSVLER